MKLRFFLILTIALLASFYFLRLAAPSEAQSAAPTPTSFLLADLKWSTVVDNAYLIPHSPVEINFSSYGQPSVNSKGTVVFRARSTGKEGSGGNRQTGIYLRNGTTDDIRAMIDLNTPVPEPNNLDISFREFPAIPRIALNRDYPATRGIHQPVYEYNLTPDTTTKVGTTGIYTEMSAGSPMTATSKLAAAPGFEFYGVPGYIALPFDVYPGAPTITDDGTVAFKGNFTVDGVGKTGIFFRRMTNAPMGGTAAVEMIADSYTEIPNWPGMYFGSTAPPSAAGNQIAFLGLDNEDEPTAGGIYVAPIAAGATLTPIVEIGKTLAGTDKQLTRIGEGLSFDGRYIAFWGAWGTDMKTVRLYCPTDGNKKLLLFCNSSASGSFQDENGLWYQDKLVPVNQGIFVYDLHKATAYQVASTPDFSDFVYWGYSGKAPGDDSEEDGEPPRWRSASFMAVSDGRVAFKARTGTLDGDTHIWLDTPTDGIYVGAEKSTQILKVIESGMDGAFIDAAIPVTMPVTGMGIERDGFRGKYLVITVSMALEETEEETDEITDWAGIYMTSITSQAKPVKTK